MVNIFTQKSCHTLRQMNVLQSHSLSYKQYYNINKHCYWKGIKVSLQVLNCSMTEPLGVKVYCRSLSCICDNVLSNNCSLQCSCF